jgi:hypothetical protein
MPQAVGRGTEPCRLRGAGLRACRSRTLLDLREQGTGRRSRAGDFQGRRRFIFFINLAANQSVPACLTTQGNFRPNFESLSGSHPVFNPVPPQSALGLSLCIRSHSSDCALSATPPSVANLSSGTSSPAAFNFAIAELPVDAAVECHRPSRRHQGVSGQRIRSGSSALSVGMQCRKEADLMRIVATEGIRRFGKWVL